MAYIAVGLDPRDDPDFAAEGGLSARIKGESGVTLISQAADRRRRIRVRSLLLAAALATIWAEILFDATIRALVLGVAFAVGCTLGVMAVAMVLGLVGFGLFALFDCAWAWVARAGRWPDH